MAFPDPVRDPPGLNERERASPGSKPQYP